MPERPDMEALAAENQALRRQVEALAGLEERCRQAEAALAAYEERNRLLGDSAPLGIFALDTREVITGINRRMLEMLGWPTFRDPRGQDISACPPLDAPGLRADIRRCMADRRTLVTEHPHTDPQGTRVHLRYYLSPIAAADGSVDGVMGIVEDFTGLKNTEEALRESEKRYRQLFQSAPIALIEWDASALKAYLEELRASGVTDIRLYLERNPREVYHCWELIRAVDHNQAFLELMGVAGGRAPAGAFIPTDSRLFVQMAREIIVAAAEGNSANDREWTLVTTVGEQKIVLANALVISGHEDTLGRVAIALMDITQRKQAEAALQERERRFREQAFRDGLTGLYNQRYLYQALAGCLERAQAAGTPVSVVFMDLDHFKQVVDTHGHLNGSRVIQQVAATIQKCLEEPAFAVAYAGDEFVMVLPGLNQVQALEKAWEIHGRVKNTAYVLEPGVEVRLRATLGVASYPEQAADLKSLIAAADHALFAAKKSGKDAVGSFRGE